MSDKLIKKYIKTGVKFINSDHVYIDETVIIGANSVIYPGVFLKGATVIGENCVIGANTEIENSQIGDGANIKHSIIIDSIVGADCNIGPFAYLRPKSELGNKVKIGDFVEVKNSKIGDGTKASHLAYIGDAEVGKDVNISCGVIFANYDGVNKFKTIIKDGAFIGSNVNLIAPIVVEEDGYIAAGTTVRKDVPADSLCVALPNVKHKLGWVSKKFGKSQKGKK